MNKYLIFCCLILELTLFGQISFELSGHLDADKMKSATAQVQKANPSEQIVITVGSNSGELPDVLSFAKTLFQTKAEKKTPVIVYMNGEALGPSAIIPFLADERYGSIYLSWGDIALGNETGLPANILRKQVMGLILDDQPQADLLRNVAAAMSDPNAPLADSKEKNERLVLNQNEIQSLKLVKSLISLQEFQHQFLPREEASETEAVPAAIPLSSLEQNFAEHIKYNREGANRIGYIKIVGHDKSISQSTWIYVKKALDYYKETKPIFIILELDTPGGEVFAAQKISDALKEMDTQEGIPVITYINNWAISAGAMLAYSTRYITVVKDGSMGAAEPVIAGKDGEMQSASEKINSALRADFANRARFFDRNPDIAEAMVDKDVILVWRNGKVVKLDTEDAIRRTGANPDRVISNKGKLLTLNALQMIEYKVGDLMISPAKIDPITDLEQEAGQWPASKSPLFHQPFFKDIPDATIDYYQMDWKTLLFTFLTSPMVASALFLGMIMGFYIEFNTPGFGLPGTIGITCLLLIIISSFALEIGNVLELILVAVGIGMLLTEIFLIPGFGLMGILGIIFFLGGVVALMLPNLGEFQYEVDSGTFNAAGDLIMERLAWLGGTIVLAVVLMAILGRYLLPSFAGFNRLVLRGGEQTVSNGYYAGDTPSQLPKVGEVGVVTSSLRPAGKIEVNGVYYDAMSAGDFIEKDTSIVIKNIVGNVVFVEKES